MPNVLILHGNGGSRTRFIPFLKQLIPRNPGLYIRIPTLSGFDGRPIPRRGNHWDLFLGEIEQSIQSRSGEEWIIYGHGIGGSILLEFAARAFQFPSGQKLKVTETILHSPLGASLKFRKFPDLMKPRIMRPLAKWLLTRKILRRLWEKRFFQQVENIPPYLREQFFEDYKSCSAFGLFYDLITPNWYEQILPPLSQSDFHFVWGERERVIQVGFLDYWKKDFPESRFEVIPDWDQFPMLEQAEAFCKHFVDWIQSP